ncbi:MAG: enoyl-CoA hydratase-related protein [Tepidiformaceae bacterium]
MATPPLAAGLTATIDPGAFDGFALLEAHLGELAASPVRALVFALPEAWTTACSDAELRRLEQFPLPTIAAFEGELSGPGLDLAVACDIRVCGADASIRARRIGHRRLLALIGHVRSAELFGRRGTLDAEGALEFGLVSDLAPAGGAVRVAEELAAVIASRGPIATRLGKEAIWRGLELPFAQALRFETDLTLLLQTTKDRAEGVRAFLEKRPPTFTGE